MNRYVYDDGNQDFVVYAPDKRAAADLVLHVLGDSISILELVELPYRVPENPAIYARVHRGSPR